MDKENGKRSKKAAYYKTNTLNGGKKMTGKDMIEELNKAIANKNTSVISETEAAMIEKIEMEAVARILGLAA